MMNAASEPTAFIRSSYGRIPPGCAESRFALAVVCAGQSRPAGVLWLSWLAPLAVAEFRLRSGDSEMPTRPYARSLAPPF
jgi:hypothetical protein